jgi:hypothetical protein
MSVTDTYVANDIVYRTLENGDANASFPTLLTSMFTSTEIVDSMNRVQQKFMLETGMILTRAAAIPGAVGVKAYALPTDNILVRRATWTTGAGDIKALTNTDTWELDNAMNGWPSDIGEPLAWWDTTLPQQEIGIAPAPDAVGSIGILYIALATTLTGLGINLTVPDDWSPYITWGTLGELLESDGQAFDPLRAKYCWQRFAEGVELARLVLGGA